MALYQVDARRSRLTVKVFSGGMLSSFGHNPTLGVRDIEGEIRFAPESPEDSSVVLRVRPERLEVIGDVKVSDRREIEKAAREEVLETSQFPEVIFESKRVSAGEAGHGYFRMELAGELTLHGRTQNQTISAQASLDAETLRANGEVPLRQSQFGIRPYSTMGGALKVKDEVKLAFEIVARRQDEDAKE